jgi:hypothetical protein
MRRPRHRGRPSVTVRAAHDFSARVRGRDQRGVARGVRRDRARRARGQRRERALRPAPRASLNAPLGASPHADNSRSGSTAPALFRYRLPNPFVPVWCHGHTDEGRKVLSHPRQQLDDIEGDRVIDLLRRAGVAIDLYGIGCNRFSSASGLEYPWTACFSLRATSSRGLRRDTATRRPRCGRPAVLHRTDPCDPRFPCEGNSSTRSAVHRCFSTKPAYSTGTVTCLPPWRPRIKSGAIPRPP